MQKKGLKIRKRMGQLLAVCFFFGLCMLKPTYPVDAAENAEQPAEVTLYALENKWAAYQVYQDFPGSGLPTEYTLPEGTWRCYDAWSVVEIEGNKVRPLCQKQYGYQTPSGYWIWQSSEPESGEYQVRETYDFSDCTLISDKGQRLLVHVKNYANFWSERYMAQYLDENIRSDMTDYEKAEVCCKFVAEKFDYGVTYTSYTGMIISGAGDCWASTNTLLYMLDKLGIKAVGREASSDLGAGSGHYNVAAKLDGKYYILDAGMVGKKPRQYLMEEMEQPFTYSINNWEQKTITLKTYINLDENKQVTIPASIGEYTVTQIGENCFVGNKDLEKVIITETVEAISEGAFERVENLEEIVVVAENSNFSSEDGVLFNKDKTTLMRYPVAKSEETYTMPDSVTTISTWAFCDVGKLKTLNFSKNLTSIEEEAFYLCDSVEELVLPDSMTEIGQQSFSNCQAKRIVLPNSVKKIGKWAFYQATFREIDLPENLETIEDYAFLGAMAYSGIIVPASVSSVGDGAFNVGAGYPTGRAATPMMYVAFPDNPDVELGTKVFDEKNWMLVVGRKGSTVQKYAEENELPYCNVNENGKIALQEEWFSLRTDDGYSTEYYQGSPVEPRFYCNYTVTPYDFAFREPGKYTCEVAYANNNGPGTGIMMITGRGIFEGTVTKTFPIFGTGGKKVLGDADGDGKITVKDALTILMHLADKNPENYFEEAADCDGIAGVTVSDALAILMHLADKRLLGS